MRTKHHRSMFPWRFLALQRQRLSLLVVLTFFSLSGLILIAQRNVQQQRSNVQVLHSSEAVVVIRPNLDDQDEDGESDGEYHWIDSSLSMLPLNHQEMEKFKDQINKNMEMSAKMAGVDLQEIKKESSSSSPSSSLVRSIHEYDSYEFSHMNSLDFDLQNGFGLDGVWQPVNGTSDKFYVYSAFYDERRGKPIVRIIGAARTRTQDSLMCNLYSLWDQGSDNKSTTVEVVTTKAKVTVIRENWNLKYSAVFVKCLVPADLKRKVHSVSVVIASNSRDPTNQLKVLNLQVVDDAELTKKAELGVCVKPLHYNFSKTVDLLQFLELNLILGASSFTFYNSSISSGTNCILRDYVSKGIVEILPWKLNMQSQVDIRTEGIFASLNDCLYRNMYKYHYLMFIDVDEFIVPKKGAITLQQMLVDAEAYQKAADQSRMRNFHVNDHSLTNKISSSYSFQNTFFYLQFANDRNESDSFVGRPALTVLQKTERKNSFNPHKTRSKYICIARQVREVGNHFVWDYEFGKTVKVPTSIGFLHHYRVCEFGGEDCVKTESVVDRSIPDMYGQELIKSVQNVLKDVQNKCEFPH